MGGKTINFVKAHGCGNDFIIINNYNGELNSFNNDYSALAQKICRRNFSVGADGLVIFDRSDKADYYMHIYDADGTKENMCGNATRCTALFASSLGMGKSFKFETGAGILEAYVNGTTVKVKMTDPLGFIENCKIQVDSKEIICHHVNTGIPHFVIFNSDNNILPIEELGRKIRWHDFSIKMGGACINFVGNLRNNEADVYTYETGVEVITNACGTGCTASAVVLAMLKGYKSPIKLHNPAGESLTIYFTKKGNVIKDVYKEGPAEIICEGRIFI